MVWIRIRTDFLSVLIWVQTVCKCYQQLTKLSNERVDELLNKEEKMKKVNKQCLLDTRSRVRKSEKLTFWQVIVQTSRP